MLTSNSNFQLAQGLKGKIIDMLYPKTYRTVAELPRDEYIAYIAVTQGNQITRGLR